MADLPTLMRLRPEYGTFLNQRNLVHRGEVVVFRPNIRSKYFSTDAFGFRHSTLDGEPLAVSEAMDRDRYGLVLGSSHIFGLGIIGNDGTIPSLLAERFGIPFANASLPEGNSRNLFSLLNGFFARSANLPAIVIHFSGGDFTSFCYGGVADSVFGSPNLKQLGNASERAADYPPPEASLVPLLQFTTLWTSMIVQLCRARKVPVVLGHDTTFFEKGRPSDLERQCKLGSPFNALQQHWFPAHQRLFPKFLARREQLAARLGVGLVGPGPRNTLTFIDEFHYDADGARAFGDQLATAIEPILSSA